MDTKLSSIKDTTSESKRQSMPSKSNPPTLPSFSDLLSGITSVPCLSPISFEQRPGMSRSYSYPMLPTVHELSAESLDSWTSQTDSPINLYRPPSPAITPPRSSSVCSTITVPDVHGDVEMAQFENILNHPNPKLGEVARCISGLLDGSVRAAYGHGWFQPGPPENEFSKRLDGKLAGKNLDELIELFYFFTDGRATYGERNPFPWSRRHSTNNNKASPDGSMSELGSDPDGVARLTKHERSVKAHQAVEHERRDRHRDLQMQGHLRCCDTAAQCGSEHAKVAKRTRCQAGKGPGKDEQLWTAIYAHEMAGRVIQAVNDQRKRAERIVELLVRLLCPEYSMSSTAMAREKDDACGVTCPSYVGRKRSHNHVEDDVLPACLYPDSHECRSSPCASQDGHPCKRLRGSHVSRKTFSTQ